MIGYRYYGDDLLLLDYIAGLPPVGDRKVQDKPQQGVEDTTVQDLVDASSIASRISRLDEQTSDLYGAVRDQLVAMGEDVQVVELKKYIAFKRIKNFACVEVFPTTNKITVFLKVNPSSIHLRPGFTRDVRGIGHYGTGDLEVSISSVADLDEATPFFRRAYESS